MESLSEADKDCAFDGIYEGIYNTQVSKRHTLGRTNNVPVPKKRRSIVGRIARDANRLMKRVSFRRKSEPHPPMRKLSTVSSPQLCLQSSMSTSIQSLAENKTKLLKVVLSHREELLKEKAVLEQMMSKSQSKMDTSFDLGYWSDRDNSCDDMASKFRGFKRQMSSTLPVSQCDEEIGNDILEEIKEFEEFIRTQQKR